jgi:hypothetical protein
VSEDEVTTDERPETAEEAPHLVLNLDGDRALFRAYPEANQFLLVKYADALAVSGFPTINAVTKLALGQVHADEKERLEAYLEEHGHADDYSQGIYSALSACWSGETLLPLS